MKFQLCLCVNDEVDRQKTDWGIYMHLTLTRIRRTPHDCNHLVNRLLNMRTTMLLIDLKNSLANHFECNLASYTTKNTLIFISISMLCEKFQPGGFFFSFVSFSYFMLLYRFFFSWSLLQFLFNFLLVKWSDNVRPYQRQLWISAILDSEVAIRKFTQ